MDSDRLAAVATDEAGWADLPAQIAAEAKAFRDDPANKAPSPKLRTVKAAQEMFTKLTPANLSKLLNSRLERDGDRELNTGTGEAPVGEGEANASGISLRQGRVEYVSSFRAQQGKRMAVPVRVEPKVYFANERTSESSFARRRGGVLMNEWRSAVVARVLGRRLGYRDWNPVVFGSPWCVV